MFLLTLRETYALSSLSSFENLRRKGGKCDHRPGRPKVLLRHWVVSSLMLLVERWEGQLGLSWSTESSTRQHPKGFTRDSCTGRYCWERVLAMGILSVCPSVCLSVRTDSSPGEIETPGLHHILESLVSYEVIWCRWVRRFSSNEDIKEGYPLRNRNFTTIGSSISATVD